MTRLLLALALFTAATGCDDDTVPAARTGPDLGADASVEPDMGDVLKPDEGLPEPDAELVPAIDPLEPPMLDLPDEAEPYAVQPASELPADMLPLRAEFPEEVSDQARFLENNLARADWLFEAFEASARPVSVAGWHDLIEPGLAELDAEIQATYVDALADAGVTTLVLPVGASPWLTPEGEGAAAALESVEAVLARAEALGLAVQVYLAPRDGAAQPVTTWAEFHDASLRLAEALVAQAGDSIDGLRVPSPGQISQLVPAAGRADTEAWQGLVDAVCARAAGAGLSCATAVDTDDGWAYVPAALASGADHLGVISSGYDALAPATWIEADRIIDAFRRGSAAGVGAGLEGRGPDGVFLSAARPTFPRTADRPFASATAGLGCIEYAELDAAWLEGVFAYAKGREINAVSLQHTGSLLYLQGCPRTVKLYASVQGAMGMAWADFQHGNPGTDPLYRAGVSIRLMAWDGMLTLTGQALRSLVDAD